MGANTCTHEDVASGYIDDRTETYCADCGVLLTVDGEDQPQPY